MKFVYGVFMFSSLEQTENQIEYIECKKKNV